MTKILETDRLILREMDESDFENLCTIMQDAEVMYAYEHAFSDMEVLNWIKWQLKNYKQNGFGLWAVILKETNEFIGQCGITMQNTPEGELHEIGYLFAKRFWHNGYVIEAAKACKEYAFSVLNVPEICSIIRVTNSASRAVAEKNGMTVRCEFVKHYYGMDMPHLLYSVKNEG